MAIIKNIDNLKIKDKGSYIDVDEAIANLQDADLAPKKYIDNKSLYVNIDDFGCVGDGATNDYNAFLDAVNFAILNNKPLYIPKKDYFLEDVDQINLTGISKIVCEGRLLVEAIDSLVEGGKPVFKIEGSKVEVESNISVNKEDNNITLSPGSRDYVQGDVFFLVSDNNIEGARDNDYKGQRLTMDYYEESSGIITFNEKFEFDLTNAVLFYNEFNPRVIIEGLSLICTNNANRTGFYFAFSTIYLNNIRVYDFKFSGVTIGSCYSVIRGFEGSGFYKTGSTTSYGLTIGDLTLSYCYNLHISGGRHAIAHGGAGSLLETDIGISSDRVARFGAVSYIFDSVFSSSESTAFDSHAVSKHTSAHNCIINGGISAYAKKNYFYKCTINASAGGSRVHLGGENTINQASYFNSCKFNLRYTHAFQLTSRIRELCISNCEFLIPFVGSSVNFLNLSHDVDNLIMINNSFNSENPQYTLNIGRVKNLSISGLSFIGGYGISFLIFEGRESIMLSDISLINTDGFPIGIADEKVAIYMSNINIRGVGGGAAVRIVKSRNILINGLNISGINGHNAKSIYASDDSGNIVVSNAFFGSENNDWDFKVSEGNLVISNSVFEKGLEVDPNSTAAVNIVNSIYQGNFIDSM